MVANFSGTDPITNGQYKLSDSYIGLRTDLGLVSWGNRGMKWKAFWDLYHTFYFSQIRWACQNADGSKSIDIATALTDKGQAVVQRFFKDTPADTCGSFYRLPADKSTLTQNCHQWAEGMWFKPKRVEDDQRLYYNPFYTPSSSTVAFLGYAFSEEYYACDERKSTEGTKGSWWRVYVR